MIEIELAPTLPSCIQTLAKREYEQTLRELLQKEGEDKYLQEKFEILKLFLESADFSGLRSHYERYLLAGKLVTFKLRSVDGQFEYEMEVR